MALVADEHLVLVGLVAVAAFQGHVLMAGMRVVLLVVAGESPQARGDLVEGLASVALGTRAELLACELLARGEHGAVLSHGIVVRHPGAHLRDLGRQLRGVAVEAGLAGLRVRGHAQVRVAGVVGFHVVVHGAVADGVAEARLLVPHPEPGAGHHDDGRHHAGDDPPALGTFLGSRSARGRR